MKKGIVWKDCDCETWQEIGDALGVKERTAQRLEEHSKSFPPDVGRMPVERYFGNRVTASTAALAAWWPKAREYLIKERQERASRTQSPPEPNSSRAA